MCTDGAGEGPRGCRGELSFSAADGAFGPADGAAEPRPRPFQASQLTRRERASRRLGVPRQAAEPGAGAMGPPRRDGENREASLQLSHLNELMNCYFCFSSNFHYKKVFVKLLSSEM